MKSLTLGFFFLAAFHLHAYSQIRKGMMYVGGTISGNYTKDEDVLKQYLIDSAYTLETTRNKCNLLYINPIVGFFVTNSFLLGAGISYSKRFSSYE